MAVLMLMYGSEFWAKKKEEERAVEADEIKCLKYVAGYTCKDQTRNYKIRQKLKIFNQNGRTQQNIK
jgi:hypothetical protein